MSLIERLEKYELDRVDLIKELNEKNAPCSEYDYQLTLLKKLHDYKSLELQMNDMHLKVIDDFLNN